MYGYQNKNVHEQDWDGGCKYKRIIKNIILKWKNMYNYRDVTKWKCKQGWDGDGR